jgi:hypothetical protein
LSAQGRKNTFAIPVVYALYLLYNQNTIIIPDKMNTALADHLTTLMAEMTTQTENVVSTGKNKSILFEGVEAAVNEETLDKELCCLKHLVKGESVPWKSAKVNPMECIPYDADAPFAKKNPKSKPKDVWWIHPEAEYTIDSGESVMSKTIAISGCYLDLVERNSEHCLCCRI